MTSEHAALGVNGDGKWVTILSRGSLTPDWDAGPVSPSDFVIGPGQRARFEIEDNDYRFGQVVSWYAVPNGLYWDTMTAGGSPAWNYTDPAMAS